MTEEKLMQAIEKVMTKQNKTYTPESNIIYGLNFDSLDFVNFIVEIEDHLNIKLDIESQLLFREHSIKDAVTHIVVKMNSERLL